MAGVTAHGVMLFLTPCMAGVTVCGVISLFFSSTSSPPEGGGLHLVQGLIRRLPGLDCAGEEDVES